jgi:hypothetical protein
MNSPTGFPLIGLSHEEIKHHHLHIFKRHLGRDSIHKTSRTFLALTTFSSTIFTRLNSRHEKGGHRMQPLQYSLYNLLQSPKPYFTLTSTLDCSTRNDLRRFIF